MVGLAERPGPCDSLAFLFGGQDFLSELSSWGSS